VRSARLVPCGLAVVVGASALAFTFAPTRLAAVGATVPITQPTPDDVRTTYLGDCATCHGSEGRGTNRGPSIVGVGRASVDYMLSSGRMPIDDPNEGLHRRKPAYGPAMRRALIDYVATFGTGGLDIPVVQRRAADVAFGGELFRLHCAACHSWAGEGGALLHREAPTLRHSTVTQIAEAIRVGPGGMPAFGTAALDDQQLASVVAYVRALRHPRDRGGLSLWHLGPLPEGAVAWVIGIGLLILATQWIGERNPRQ
jgi:ubiquinol-cytochrome c reductase cytochrome c subunit